ARLRLDKRTEIIEQARIALAQRLAAAARAAHPLGLGHFSPAQFRQTPPGGAACDAGGPRRRRLGAVQQSRVHAHRARHAFAEADASLAAPSILHEARAKNFPRLNPRLNASFSL